MRSLYPRELYPGFREVFGYLLMSSGVGVLVKLWDLGEKGRVKEE